MSSGVGLLVLGFLMIVFAIIVGSACTINYDVFAGTSYSCSVSLFLPFVSLVWVITGGGVLSLLIGTVFTAVGYSKGEKEVRTPKPSLS